MKLTDTQIASTWISQTGNQSVLCEWDVEGFARAIESAVREQVIEEAAKVCQARAVRYSCFRGLTGQIFAQTQDEEARQCASAIRALSEKS